jgi:hypothetical protein
MKTKRLRLEIRLDADLKAALDVATKKGSPHGDKSDFVRTAIKHALVDCRTPTTAQLAQFNKISRDLEGAARNINQLAKAANQARLGYGTSPQIEDMEAAVERIDALGMEALKIMRMWA